MERSWWSITFHYIWSAVEGQWDRSIWIIVRARWRRKESSRSLSHLLMSFLLYIQCESKKVAPPPKTQEYTRLIIRQIFASERGGPHFNAIAWGDPLPLYNTRWPNGRSRWPNLPTYNQRVANRLARPWFTVQSPTCWRHVGWTLEMTRRCSSIALNACGNYMSKLLAAGGCKFWIIGLHMTCYPIRDRHTIGLLLPNRQPSKHTILCQYFKMAFRTFANNISEQYCHIVTMLRRYAYFPTIFWQKWKKIFVDCYCRLAINWQLLRFVYAYTLV